MLNQSILHPIGKGRPPFHKKAKTIQVNIDGLIYSYNLNKKGTLIKDKNNNMISTMHKIQHSDPIIKVYFFGYLQCGPLV